MARRTVQVRKYLITSRELRTWFRAQMEKQYGMKRTHPVTFFAPLTEDSQARPGTVAMYLGCIRNAAPDVFRASHVILVRIRCTRSAITLLQQSSFLVRSGSQDQGVWNEALRAACRGISVDPSALDRLVINIKGVLLAD
jgi:hypothetical protein